MKTTYPQRVRIIAGQWRRRWLDVSPMPQVRPTPDRVRETLFNWLAPYLNGAKCLDLFAGTGVLGLEALSRGAASVTFVEQDLVVISGLRTNIAQLGATAAHIIQADAVNYLETANSDRYHIIFVDPPFASGLAVHILTVLNRWLLEDGVIYLETPNNLDDPLHDGWRIMRSGTTRHTQFRLLARA